MSKSVYEPIGDGWEDLPKSMELACCDCSLVHSIVYRVRIKNGQPKLQWKVDRNERATAALRRKRKRASASK